MTSEASTTTWETLVEQYRERAARDDARIEELRQRTEHWHDTADMLKRQRDMAEQERDEWKRKYLDEAGAHDKTRRAWGEEAADMTRNAMRDGSEFGSLLSERDALRAERDEWKIRAMASEQQRQALRAERDALRKVTATMEELAREAYAHWDNDADSNVGKCLVALSGATGFRKDLDRARDAAMEAKV